LLLGLLSELLKVKSDVNAGQEGLVKCSDSVSGKGHDPTIVFKVTRAVAGAFSKRRERGSTNSHSQDRHHGILLEITVRVLFEEYVHVVVVDWGHSSNPRNRGTHI
jgi:hypothetical protein